MAISFSQPIPCSGKGPPRAAFQLASLTHGIGVFKAEILIQILA
ncbi:hypothetical protein BMETH_480_0 [methanotrophic bacterial endosymbiont of Bathymodiolus sp.]|nr:hypothetical protein BMETH_480_0 [methanotrophic bacterial endosymbiont of Bathymodiolus sp.]